MFFYRPMPIFEPATERIQPAGIQCNSQITKQTLLGSPWNTMCGTCIDSWFPHSLSNPGPDRRASFWPRAADRPRPLAGVHEIAKDHQVAGQRKERVALNAVKQWNPRHRSRCSGSCGHSQVWSRVSVQVEPTKRGSL